MPNAKVLSEKQAMVAQLAEKMKSATSGVLVDYKGITVEEDTKLRSELRKANVEYTVVKNTLVRFAANQIGFEELDGVLHGTTAMAVSVDDPTAPARLLAEFAKSHDKYFNIKAGFLEGKVVDVATVESLAAAEGYPAVHCAGHHDGSCGRPGSGSAGRGRQEERKRRGCSRCRSRNTGLIIFIKN